MKACRSCLHGKEQEAFFQISGKLLCDLNLEPGKKGCASWKIKKIYSEEGVADE